MFLQKLVFYTFLVFVSSFLWTFDLFLLLLLLLLFKNIYNIILYCIKDLFSSTKRYVPSRSQNIFYYI